MGTPSWIEYREVSVANSAPAGTSISQPFTIRPREHHRHGGVRGGAGEKIIKDGGCKELLRNDIFCDKAGLLYTVKSPRLWCTAKPLC